MPTIVSLLRGVNVGGHNKVKMAALRETYVSAGLEQPQTYIQSGNVVFRTSERKPTPLAERIASAILRNHGIQTTVILRTLAEMERVLKNNPFEREPAFEAKKLLVLFLNASPAAKSVKEIESFHAGPETLQLDGRELYIYFPNGMGRSKLSIPALERRLTTPGTGRNWNTVRKLAELARSLD